MTESSGPRSRSTAIRIVGVVLTALVAVLVAGPARGEEPAAKDDTSIPAPLVIETLDGNEVMDDPLIAEALAAVERQQQIEREDDTNRTLAVSDTMSVRYLTTPPADVKAVVEEAVLAWEDVLVTNEDAPIVIEFDWRILPANLLGLAAPTSYERSPDLPTDALYPVALANTLLRTDRAPGRAEISITLASNLYGISNGWYVDPVGSAQPVPAGQLDLFTVVVHEIGHGLGFTGSARNAQLGDDLFVYDLLARANGVPLTETNVADALTSGDLFIDIGGGRTAELFAPSRFVNRVSYNHFDERDDASEAGGLMTPVFGRGESNRTIDAATLGVMSQLGWPIEAPVVTPRVVATRTTATGLEIQFRNDIGRRGLPPFSHKVTATAADGTLLAAQTVGWETDVVTIPDLADGRGVKIRIEAFGTTTSGASASVVLTDRPSQLSVSGVGTARSVTWRPPTAPLPGSITYLVERRSTTRGWQAIGTSPNEFLADTGLAAGIYQYRVTTIVDGETAGASVTPVVGVATDVLRPMSLDGQIGRLYLAFFGRSADTAGLAFWVEQRAIGLPVEAIAASFAESDEFRAIAGEPDNGAFVDSIYRNVLGRNPDAEGRAFWVDRLDNGLARGDLVVAFSDAPEFVTLTETAPPTSGAEGAVTRLYWAFLQRPPEPDGLTFWTDEIATGRSNLVSVANGFAQSPEFVSTYGILSNQEFLDLVYDNVLGRRADDAGFNYWLGQLESGRDRGDIMLAFANSPEFIIKTGTLP